MQRFGAFFTQSWYLFLDQRQKDLVRTTLELYSREERLKSAFSDYSFIIFPMAKAYEGFLKKYLFETGMITHEMSVDKKFRIGRALNRDIHPDRRGNDWIYGKVEEICGKDVAHELWETWIICRNQIFHYYADTQKVVTMDGAGQCIMMLADAMEHAVACQRIRPERGQTAVLSSLSELVQSPTLTEK